MMCFLLGDFMYEKFSIKITNLLIQHSFIQENDSEIYVYSFQIILSTLVSTIFILIWSILFKQILNTIFFLIGFFMCRKSSGGYHANSQTVCFVFTQLIFISFLTLITFSNILENKNILIFVTIFSNILIYFFAPVDNANKPFLEYENRKYRRQSKVFILINIMLFFVTMLFSMFVNIYFCYMLGVLAISIMLVLGKIKNMASLKQ